MITTIQVSVLDNNILLFVLLYFRLFFIIDLIVRKRIINHRNKQIETRIKRKVIIENGQMILDSGPQVTTKTIEDTRQESEEYDKNGQQTYQTSNDDNDQINKNDGNDDGNKVVNDTNKCHKSNSNKT